MQKVPYMLVVGAREMDNGTVAVRARGRGDLREKKLADFAAEVVGQSRFDH